MFMEHLLWCSAQNGTDLLCEVPLPQWNAPSACNGWMKRYNLHHIKNAQTYLKI